LSSRVHNFSPSQYEAFVHTCKRYWYGRWILRWPVEEKDFQKFGVKVHKGIEIRTDSGLIAPDTSEEIVPFVQAVEPFLPPIGEPEVCTELRFDMPTHLGVPWKGVIDLLRPSVRPIILRDWKTLSDFRYAKTPDELRRDIQLNSYAEYVFQVLEEHDEDHGDVIDGGLVYIKTAKKKKKKNGEESDEKSENKSKKKSKPKKPKVLPVVIDLHRDVVREVWQSTRPTLDQMMAIAELEDFNEVEPTTTSCDKYGGCPFRVKCGLEPRAPGLNPKKEKTVPSFLDKLKNKTQTQAQTETKPENKPEPERTETKAETKPENKSNGQPKTGFLAKARGQQTQAETTSAPPPSNAPAPTIVPPDAPARDSNAPLQAGDPGHKEEQKAAAEDNDAELAAQDDANVETEAASGRKKPGRKPKATNGAAKKNGFTLFIDVIMVKGSGEIEPTTLEDWFGPIDMELNEHVKQESNLPSWWLLSYADQKAALSIAVQEKISKGLPPSMLISSSSALTRDILPMLMPHATEVYRSLRG
jgi:hypothetical protein